MTSRAEACRSSPVSHRGGGHPAFLALWSQHGQSPGQQPLAAGAGGAVAAAATWWPQTLWQAAGITPPALQGPSSPGPLQRQGVDSGSDVLG